MGGQQAFGWKSAPDNTQTWNTTGMHSGFAVPTGRGMANGWDAIMPVGIVMYLGGLGPGRTATIYVGPSSLALQVPAAGGGQAVGGSCSTRGVIDGGTASEGGAFYGGGGIYIGDTNLAGATMVSKQDGTVYNNRRIAGYYDWIEAPSAPGTPNATVSGDDVTLSWAGPADVGGPVGPGGFAGLTGYQVQYSKVSNFSSGVTTINLGNVGSTVISNLDEGATYYFRVAAKNWVTDASGTTSVWSGTRSASIPSGMRYDNGSAWVDVLGWYYDDGANWDPVNEWFYDNGTAWVALQ